MKKKFVKIVSTFASVFLVSSCFRTKAESFKILADAGHGGSATGCTYEYDGEIVNEKDLNLKIALHFKNELEKYRTETGDDVVVYTTRSSDEDVPLTERVRQGIDKGANVIISLHNNAHGDKSKKRHGAMVLVTSSHYNNLYETEEV